MMMITLAMYIEFIFTCLSTCATITQHLHHCCTSF